MHYLVIAKLFTQNNYIPDTKVCLEKEQGYFSATRSREISTEKSILLRRFLNYITSQFFLCLQHLLFLFSFQLFNPIIIHLCNNIIPKIFFFWLDRHRLYRSAFLIHLVGVPKSHSDCTSSTATSCPFRSKRKVRGCFESSPRMTSQPRSGIETMCVFRSVLSLWKMSLLSFTLHQRSRQRLLESTLRYPAIKCNMRCFTPHFFWKGRKKTLLNVMLAFK